MSSNSYGSVGFAYWYKMKKRKNKAKLVDSFLRYVLILKIENLT